MWNSSAYAITYQMDEPLTEPILKTLITHFARQVQGQFERENECPHGAFRDAAA
jgi:hypothetical protein